MLAPKTCAAAGPTFFLCAGRPIVAFPFAPATPPLPPRFPAGACILLLLCTRTTGFFGKSSNSLSFPSSSITTGGETDLFFFSLGGKLRCRCLSLLGGGGDDPTPESFLKVVSNSGRSAVSMAGEAEHPLGGVVVSRLPEESVRHCLRPVRCSISMSSSSLGSGWRAAR